MTTSRKHVSFFRILGAIILSLLINIGLLYLVDWLLRTQLHSGAMHSAFYIIFALAAVLLFFLLLFPANRPFRRFKVFLRWLLIVVSMLGIWAGGSVWQVQNEMIYHPESYQARDAERATALSGVKQLTVPDVNGLKYSGYLWQPDEGSQGMVIYFGGNGEFAASTMVGLADSAGAKEMFKGYRVLAVDYPGYGLSEGKPGEESNYRMALAAWDYVQAMQPKPEKVVLMAWSLGTGVASRLAAEKNPAGLVLMAPFYSGARLMDDYVGMRLFEPWLGFLVRNKYPSFEYAQSSKVNALIIAAAGDSMVPARQAEALAEHYENKQLLMVEGGHNSARFSQQTEAVVASYLRSVLPPLMPQVQAP